MLAVSRYVLQGSLLLLPLVIGCDGGRPLELDAEGISLAASGAGLAARCSGCAANDARWADPSKF